MLDALIGGFRYTRGLWRYLRPTLTPGEARELIERQLAGRADAFLAVLERGIYMNAQSPYRKLLRHANIELSDVSRWVRDVGLEGTLTRLYDVGVYLTSKEFKGRRPIRRHGIEFAVTASDFDNPLLGSSRFGHSSGGSSGDASRVLLDFDLIKHEAACIASVLAAHGIADRPVAIWRAALTDGFKTSFRYAMLGNTPKKWFSLATFTWSGEALTQSSFLTYTLLVSRLVRRSLPRREFVPRDDVLKVVRWLADMKERGTPAILETTASPCVRVCLAARERAIDVSGTVFHVVGEPYTRAKADVVASVGARGINRYSIAELGVVAVGCARPSEFDDLHVITDKVAVIPREKEVDASGARVDALVFTSLLSSSPKLMLNVESDDYGTLTTRECGCLLGVIGLSTHLTGIRSYEKLTSEGVTFIGSDLYHLLEDVLPARFGGGPTDYQLVEEEEQGLPRVSLVVAPRVGVVEERDLIAAVLQTLKTHPGGGRLMAQEWQQGNTLRVARREPYATRTAKIFPLHVLKPTSPTSANQEVMKRRS